MTIQINHLFFQYDQKTPLLEDISLEIPQGSCVAIFGPNGGGKTTLLKLLMGFLKPMSGSIFIGGTIPEKNRQQMGYVPQIANLDRDFPITVLEVVTMGALPAYSQNSRKEALEMLDKVGLKQMAEAHFGSLSGGQSQRVLIARALMGNPQYLFLDEVTSHVDPSAEKQFHGLIKELKGQLTIVMVTHALPSVMSYIDRFLCVYGKITPYSPAEICNHFVQGLYHPPLTQNLGTQNSS